MNVKLTHEREKPDPALRAWFDQPSFDDATEGHVQFSGWCFHSEHRLTGLQLNIGSASHDVRFGLHRPDVARAFPAAMDAARSGFSVFVPLKPGRYNVSLRARIGGNNGIEQIVHRRRLIVRRRTARRVTGGTATNRWLVTTVIGKARARLAEGRGLPSLRELRVLLRLVKDDHARKLEVADAPFTPPVRVDPYQVWLDLNRWTPARANQLRERLDAARDLPLLTVVTPVYRPDLDHIRETAASVRNQVYTRWQWCLADDASNDAALTSFLNELAEADPRIRVVVRSENGHISRATNSAAALAQGDFIVFLDHDDLLSPDALAEVALHLAANPDVDVLYSDDDKVDMNGRRYGPQFKPDWSPETLLAQMYCCHLLVVRRRLFAELGGLRVGFEGSQDHDLALRATEKARRVAHLPYVLYHWRAVPGSTALDATAKPYSFDAGRRAVEEALCRRGVSAAVDRPDWAVAAGLSLFRHNFPDDGPSVAILISSRNRIDLLRRCISSLATTTYRNHRVAIVDDHSDDPETVAFLAAFDGPVLRRPGPRERFSYAALNNYGAAAVAADFVLFLNDDTEVRNPKWLTQMVGFAKLPGVGAVGARLLFPDGSIQHAGILHGFGQGRPGVACRGLDGNDPGYLGAAMSCRNCSAVTAACMLTPRKLFLEMGGFDEDAFAVSFNDVDYGYRLIDRGYRCVVAPEAELTHDEGASRGLGSSAEETARLRERYRHRSEPYYNPNLSIANERFEIQPRRLPRSRRRLRVVMYTHALDLTGAPWCQFELGTAFRDSGDFEVAVFSPEDGPLRARYEAEGISLELVPNGGLGSIDDHRATVAALTERIANREADVVFASTLRSFAAVYAARKASIPSVWNVRESEPWQDYYSYLPTPVSRIALDCFSAPYRVVFDSGACRAGFEALNSRCNFQVIHTGLPPTRWARESPVPPRPSARAELGIAPGDIAFVLVGTVCERKGQADLIGALQHLPDYVATRVQCFLVGDRPGEYSDRLAAMIAGLPEQARSRTHLIVETEGVSPYYRAADVFVCTSRVESFPRVTLEAMSFGLPIISTPVFGLREQLRGGVNAMFYPPGDVVALAEAMKTVCTNGDSRDRMARESTLVLLGLTSFEEMVHQYATCLREAADTR